MGFDVNAARRYLRRRAVREAQARESRRAAAEAAVAECVRAVAPGFANLRRAYLFGSVVRPGGFRLDSDVDLAVTGLSAEDFFRFWKAVEAAAPDQTIDLRDLDEAPALAERVRASGRVIYARDVSDPESGPER